MVLGTGLRKEEERIGFADQICRRDGSTRPADTDHLVTKEGRKIARLPSGRLLDGISQRTDRSLL